MKPSLLFVVALATMVSTLCSSFSPANNENAAKTERVCVAAAKASASMSAFFDAHYYWYFVPGGALDGYYTFGEEALRQQFFTGTWCDGNPSGTLVASGYILPRNGLLPPFSWVFAHY